MLTPEDLAYMRETQAEARPTTASLRRTTSVSDGAGGRKTVQADPEPIAVRIAHADAVPAVVAEKYGPEAVQITLDLVAVASGDVIVVSPGESYKIVSDGSLGEWTTAQVVAAVRHGVGA